MIKKIVLLFFSFRLLVLASQPDSLSTKINDFLVKGNYSDATILLKEKIKSDSSNIAFLEKLGFCFQNLYKYDEAITVFNKVLKLDTLNTSAFFNIGKSHYQQGNIEKALQYYERAYNMDTLNSNIMLNLGNLYIEKNQLKNAKKIFLQLNKTDTSSIYSIKKLGFINYKLNNMDKSFEYYQTAYHKNPKDPAVILYLANMFLKKDSTDNAITILERGLEIFPNHIKINKLLGDINFNLKDYVNATVYYSTAVGYGDSTASNYQRLGLCSYFINSQKNIKIGKEAFKGKISSALMFLEKSFELNPDDAYTCLYIGLCHKELEDYATAREYLDKSLNMLLPDYLSTVYTQLANVYAKEENFQEAIKAYHKSLEYKDSKRVILQLAVIYERYYADKNVPLLYYNLYLAKGKDDDPRLIEYAKDRVEILKEAIHFSSSK